MRAHAASAVCLCVILAACSTVPDRFGGGVAEAGTCRHRMESVGGTNTLEVLFVGRAFLPNIDDVVEQARRCYAQAELTVGGADVKPAARADLGIVSHRNTMDGLVTVLVTGKVAKLLAVDSGQSR